MPPTMKIKTTTAKINNEAKEGAGLCCLCMSFMLMTCVSYCLTSFLFMVTSVELNTWQKQNMNYTNFEEITMEHFRMHILMNVYLLIIIINIFFVELSFWGPRYFIQLWLWGTEEWRGHRLIGSLLVYLVFLVGINVISLFSSPIPKEQYLKIEYTPYQLTKLYFYFQLAAIWCLFQLIIEHIVIYWIRTRGYETTYGTVQSTVMMTQQEEQYFQSEKTTIRVSLAIRNQDDKTAQIPQTPTYTVCNIE